MSVSAKSARRPFVLGRSVLSFGCGETPSADKTTFATAVYNSKFDTSLISDPCWADSDGNPCILEIDVVLGSVVAKAWGQDVALISAVARLLALRKELRAWLPALKDNGSRHTGHRYCYRLSNPMIGKECVQLPPVAFERAFCPSAEKHPAPMALNPKAVALAAGAVLNYPLTKHLLERGEGKGDGALIGGCLVGDIHYVQYFREAFQDQIDSRFRDVTPIHAAATSGNVPLIELILDMLGPARQATVLRKNSFMENCLHVALRCEHLEAARVFLREGCPADSAALCRAISTPTLHPFAEEIISKVGSDARGTSSLNSGTPLSAACSLLQRSDADQGRWAPSANFAWRLLEHQKADPNQGRDYRGNSPLHLAVRNGHIELVRALIHCGADVDAQTHDGDTALHYCCMMDEEDDTAIAVLLLESGADQQVQCHGKEKLPVDIAEKRSNQRMVKLLSANF